MLDLATVLFSLPNGKTGSNVGWNEFYKLENFDRKDCAYIRDDTVTWEFKVVVQTGVVDTVAVVSPAASSSAGSNLQALSTDIATLLHHKRHTDVVLHVGADEAQERLQAHRLILAARSPVFDKMLYGTGMQEAAPDAEVHMPDMQLDVAKQFLHSLYTNEIHADAWEDDEMLCHLLAAFHKYEVTALATRCELQIITCLTEDNVAERLMMADLLNIPGLKKQVLDFATGSRERLSRIQATDGFQRLAQLRPLIVVEILAMFAPPAKRTSNPARPDLPANLANLRIVDLKQHLTDRGLPTSGPKMELIERLRAYVNADPSRPA
eukprot:gnl/TRDRNA2_/TRDRNA2_86422_c1_seq1.p1 gnl/TRDRNA2_/TRDRNA2_86422_c1~~gnl/TRDRNA2_/TRDRNA2_86422_c1_seq1.p1  ORF type:complete len:343 (+),score=62.34 gnl/TRDRNA2_/TRDRNA2_86422_c1_seq1:62-1030(+)